MTICGDNAEGVAAIVRCDAAQRLEKTETSNDPFLKMAEHPVSTVPYFLQFLGSI